MPKWHARAERESVIKAMSGQIYDDPGSGLTGGMSASLATSRIDR